MSIEKRFDGCDLVGAVIIAAFISALVTALVTFCFTTSTMQNTAVKVGCAEWVASETNGAPKFKWLPAGEKE